jgi:MFS family permease
VNAASPEGFVNWLGAVLGSPLTGDALIAGTKWTFVVAGILSFVLAAYSLTLPHTPPKKVESGAESKLAWVEAVKLLGIPFILVLWVVTFVDATVHNLFFNWTGRFLGTPVEAGGVGIAGNWIMPVMSIGQVAEILTMLILGATLKKLGWRVTMIIGILGHAARFAVFAFMPQNKELIILVNLLHGICYAFFFATVYIFVDEFFPKDARASAQGLFNLMILGLGPLVANAIGPVLIGTTFNKGGVVDFKGLFLIPAGAAVVAAIALAVFFRPPKSKEAQVISQPATAH